MFGNSGVYEVERKDGIISPRISRSHSRRSHNSSHSSVYSQPKNIITLKSPKKTKKKKKKKPKKKRKKRKSKSEIKRMKMKVLSQLDTLRTEVFERENQYRVQLEKLNVQYENVKLKLKLKEKEYKVVRVQINSRMFTEKPKSAKLRLIGRKIDLSEQIQHLENTKKKLGKSITELQDQILRLSSQKLKTGVNKTSPRISQQFNKSANISLPETRSKKLSSMISSSTIFEQVPERKRTGKMKVQKSQGGRNRKNRIEGEYSGEFTKKKIYNDLDQQWKKLNVETSKHEEWMEEYRKETERSIEQEKQYYQHLLEKFHSRNTQISLSRRRPIFFPENSELKNDMPERLLTYSWEGRHDDFSLVHEQQTEEDLLIDEEETSVRKLEELKALERANRRREKRLKNRMEQERKERMAWLEEKKRMEKRKLEERAAKGEVFVIKGSEGGSIEAPDWEDLEESYVEFREDHLLVGTVQILYSSIHHFERTEGLLGWVKIRFFLRKKLEGADEDGKSYEAYNAEYLFKDQFLYEFERRLKKLIDLFKDDDLLTTSSEEEEVEEEEKAHGKFEQELSRERELLVHLQEQEKKKDAEIARMKSMWEQATGKLEEEEDRRKREEEIKKKASLIQERVASELDTDKKMQEEMEKKLEEREERVEKELKRIELQNCELRKKEEERKRIFDLQNSEMRKKEEDMKRIFEHQRIEMQKKEEELRRIVGLLNSEMRKKEEEFLARRYKVEKRFENERKKVSEENLKRLEEVKQLEELKEKLENQKQTIETEKKGAVEAEAEKKKENEEMMEEIEKERIEVEKMKKDNESLKNELETMKEEIKNTTMELEKERRDLEELRKKEKKKIRKKKSKWESESEKLEEEKKEMKLEKNRIKEREKQVEEEKRDLEVSVKMFDQRKKLHEEKKDIELEAQAEEMDRREAKHNETTESFKKMVNELKQSQKARVKELKVELKKREDEVGEKQKEIARMKELNDRKVAENKRMEKRLGKQGDKIREMKEIVKKLEEEEEKRIQEMKELERAKAEEELRRKRRGGLFGLFRKKSKEIPKTDEKKDRKKKKKKKKKKVEKVEAVEDERNKEKVKKKKKKKKKVEAVEDERKEEKVKKKKKKKVEAVEDERREEKEKKKKIEEEKKEEILEEEEEDVEEAEVEEMENFEDSQEEEEEGEESESSAEESENEETLEEEEEEVEEAEVEEMENVEDSQEEEEESDTEESEEEIKEESSFERETEEEQDDENENSSEAEQTEEEEEQQVEEEEREVNIEEEDEKAEKEEEQTEEEVEQQVEEEEKEESEEEEEEEREVNVEEEDEIAEKEEEKEKVKEKEEVVIVEEKEEEKEEKNVENVKDEKTMENVEESIVNDMMAFFEHVTTSDSETEEESEETEEERLQKKSRKLEVEVDRKSIQTWTDIVNLKDTSTNWIMLKQDDEDENKLVGCGQGSEGLEEAKKLIKPNHGLRYLLLRGCHVALKDVRPITLFISWIPSFRVSGPEYVRSLFQVTEVMKQFNISFRRSNEPDSKDNPEPLSPHLPVLYFASEDFDEELKKDLIRKHVRTILQQPGKYVVDGTSQKMIVEHIQKTRHMKESSSEKKEIAKNNVFKEIIATEETYVQSLDVFVKDFLTPMKSVEPQFARQVLNSITIILQINSAFLEKLRKVYPDTQDEEEENESKKSGSTSTAISEMVDILVAQCPIFKLYIPYINQYQQYLSTYHDLMGSNNKTEFQEFVAKTQLELKKKGFRNSMFSGFLIMPIQRIPRYPLLFRDLLKQTSTTDPNYEKVSEGCVKTGELASYMNMKKAEAEMSEMTIRIAQKYDRLKKILYNQSQREKHIPIKFCETNILIDGEEGQICMFHDLLFLIVDKKKIAVALSLEDPDIRVFAPHAQSESDDEKNQNLQKSKKRSPKKKSKKKRTEVFYVEDSENLYMIESTKKIVEEYLVLLQNALMKFMNHNRNEKTTKPVKQENRKKSLSSVSIMLTSQLRYVVYSSWLTIEGKRRWCEISADYKIRVYEKREKLKKSKSLVPSENMIFGFSVFKTSFGIGEPTGRNLIDRSLVIRERRRSSASGSFLQRQRKDSVKQLERKSSRSRIRSSSKKVNVNCTFYVKRKGHVKLVRERKEDFSPEAGGLVNQIFLCSTKDVSIMDNWVHVLEIFGCRRRDTIGFAEKNRMEEVREKRKMKEEEEKVEMAANLASSFTAFFDSGLLSDSDNEEDEK